MGEQRSKLIRYDAFLSYRHVEPDQSFARNLLQGLEGLGYKIAIDERDFAANESWLEEMARCIRESHFTLAVISPRYFEGGAALEESLLQKTMDLDPRGGRKRRLIPIIFEKTEFPDWLYGLSNVDFSATNPLIPPLERLKASLGPPHGITRAGESPPFEGKREDILPFHRPGPFKLVYTQVTAKGVLDWDLSPIAPYDHLVDPTDVTGERLRATIVVAFPHTEYLKGSYESLKSFTAVTAICSLQPEQVASALLRIRTVSELDPTEPRKHFEDRERLFRAISAALGGTFVVAVAVPATLLRAARRKPKVSLQALTSMFLVPVVELHRKLAVQEIHIRLAYIGECTPKLEALARAALHEAFPKKNSSTVEVIGADQLELRAVADAAGHLVWAVERLYNWGEDKWLASFVREP